MPTLRINTTALLHNLKALQAAAGDAQVIPVLKANAYGLGAVRVAALLAQAGVRLVAVSRLEEAEELAAARVPLEVLLMTPYHTESALQKIAALGLTAAIESVEQAQTLNALAQGSVKVHLKFDTGMGRFGFLPPQAKQAAEAVLALKNLRVTGVFSHLSNCFRPGEKSVLCQAEAFDGVVNTLRENGVEPGLTHLANTNGLLLYPGLRHNAVRSGSALLGRLAYADRWGFRPVCELQAEICGVRTLPAGHTIGYANTYITKQKTRVAVVPVGYADGIFTEKSRDTFRFFDLLRYLYHDALLLLKKPRLAGVLHGRRVPVVGRVGLTNLSLDVTNVDCAPGDTVSFYVNPLLVRETAARVYAEDA
ncbi:MAG: alanine racemase [Oscillospiraceae bacterium]|jgi:alanine racemase|nr:alanine racemase [Oscillospiraceae bacterium]